MRVKSLSYVWLFATPWTAAYQASPSRGFSRQEYWSGVPLPSPLSCFSHVQVASVHLRNPMDWSRQAPLSKGFSRQEYWNGLPYPPPGDFCHPGIESLSLVSPVIYVSQGCFLSGGSRGVSNPCLFQPLAFLGLWLHHLLLGDLPTQGLLHYRHIFYQLSHQRSPILKASVIQMVFSVCQISPASHLERDIQLHLGHTWITQNIISPQNI